MNIIEGQIILQWFFLFEPIKARPKRMNFVFFRLIITNNLFFIGTRARHLVFVTFLFSRLQNVSTNGVVHYSIEVSSNRLGSKSCRHTFMLRKHGSINFIFPRPHKTIFRLSLEPLYFVHRPSTRSTFFFLLAK